MGCAAALGVRIHGGSILVAIRHRHIKIGAAIEWSLTLTVETHRDSSRLVAHLSTLISSVATIIHRRSPCWLTANRSSTRHAFSRQAHASADGSPRTHHRNSQQLESLRDSPIHMDRRHFDDGSATLTALAPGDSTVHTTRISATKSAPRRIVGLAPTIEIHSDWSRSEADLSTWINGASMMSRRHSPFRLTAIRWSTRRASRQQNPRLGGSSASRSPSKFTAIRVAPGPTYPHG